KGHATPVIYAVLAEAGYFDVELLAGFRRLDSPLQGHVVRNTPPGIEMSGGALGLGLSFSNGLALAARLDHAPWRVYCLLGDGELNEGQNWEAALAAAHFGFGHITAIVDRNGYQNDGPSDEIMRLHPLPEKWRAFGWHVIQVEDGHDLQQLLDAFGEAQTVTDRPQVIIAPTLKGKGVSFMEADPAGWHGKGPTDEQLAQALKDIGA
ncbi:MAG: transketolase, partial [Dehalococcoidia bacterium]